MIIIRIIIKIYDNDDDNTYKLPTINFAKVSQFSLQIFYKDLNDTRTMTKTNDYTRQ